MSALEPAPRPRPADVQVRATEYERAADSLAESWARDAHQIAQVAMNLAKTAFVPASFNRDPAQVTAAILTGLELGMKPMAALRSFDIIQGTPAPRAIAMRALVQGAGHDMWTVESTKTRAIVKGRRAGSEHVEESVWTIDRARDLGLLNKSNWKQQPIAMLLARATSECARLVAADVILGVAYSAEELADQAGAAEPDAPVTRTRKTAKRAALPDTAAPDLPMTDEQPAPLARPVEQDEDYEARERAEFDPWQADQQEEEK